MSDEETVRQTLNAIAEELDGELVQQVVRQVARLEGDALMREAVDLAAAGSALRERLSGGGKWPKTRSGTGPLQTVQETADAPPGEVKA